MIVQATIRFRKNIKLANYCASKFSSPIDGSMDKEDVYQDAYLGLWLACLRFDESKGFEFSTYAIPMINGNILRSFRYNESLKTSRIHKDIRNALLKHGFTLPLSDEEINVLVSEKKFSREQVMDYASVEVFSLDKSVKEDDDSLTLANIIPDKNSYISDALDEDELESAIDHILLYIKPNHRDMVEEWIYATLAGEKITHMDLVRKYNISQPTVCRILKSAIEMCKLHREEILKALGI